MYRTLIYFLYWTAQAIAFPFLLLYLGWRIARNPHYEERLSERFGFWRLKLPPSSPDRIWLHAVSVGEILTVLPLLRQLRAEMPGANIYVSSTTLAGRQLAESRLGDLVDGVFFAPVDYRFAVRRVLRRIRPSLVVVLETEIWPNLYRDSKRSGARLLIVNGRISDHAIQRYRRFAFFFRHVLQWPDRILAQGEIAQSRYAELGAEAGIGGNLKFDQSAHAKPVAEDLDAWLAALQPRAVWIAASTMPPQESGDPDEDDVFCAAWPAISKQHPGLLGILVPRRPERFDSAAARLEAAGIPFVRRSQLDSRDGLSLPGVLLLDSIGELAGLFSRADLVFMGGSLAQRGGHNPLEPSVYAVPIVAGPHMENFAEITAEMTRAGAIARITGQAELAPAASGLLSDASRRRDLGTKAQQIVSAHGGATARAVREIAHWLPQGLYRPLHSWPALLFGGAASLLWRAGVAIDRWARGSSPAHLPKPVISAGNVAMGGTGKTPFVLWLCTQLREQGLEAAVLTRGYRRDASKPVLVVPSGSTAPWEETGDEAQLYIRGGFSVAIGGNRRRAAQELLKLRQPGVFVLDDGFQHWSLPSRIDIVLIDAIDPYRGGVFPLGRLREPFSALRRAHAIVLTRTERGRRYDALHAMVRRYNHAAPIFHARLQPAPLKLPRGVAGAFCGLGQPASFARTLHDLGVQPAFLETFPDHHQYTAGEILRLRARADFLLTTEKDYLNIDAESAAHLTVIPVAVEMEMDDAGGFADWLNAAFSQVGLH